MLNLIKRSRSEGKREEKKRAEKQSSEKKEHFIYRIIIAFVVNVALSFVSTGVYILTVICDGQRFDIAWEVIEPKLRAAIAIITTLKEMSFIAPVKELLIAAIKTFLQNR